MSQYIMVPLNNFAMNQNISCISVVFY